MTDPLTGDERKYLDDLIAEERVAEWLDRQRPRRGFFSGYLASDGFKGTLVGSVAIPVAFALSAYGYDRVSPTAAKAREQVEFERKQAETAQQLDELTKLLPLALGSDKGREAVKELIAQRCLLMGQKGANSCNIDPLHPHDNSLYATFLRAIGAGSSSPAAGAEGSGTRSAPGATPGSGGSLPTPPATGQGAPPVTNVDAGAAARAPLTLAASPGVVYIQFYDEGMRPAASRLSAAFQSFAVAVPGIENVCNTHPSPAAVCIRAVTGPILVRYYRDADANGADFAAGVIARVFPNAPIRKQTLAGRAGSANVRPGLVEIWLPRDLQPPAT